MPIIDFIIGLPALAQVSLYPVTCTCTATLLPVTFIPVIGEVIVTCMCLAPIGSIPVPIDMDGLGIVIECDISGIRDLVWPAAAEGLPDEPQAAATSESAATPTPALKAEPGHERPGDAHLDMDRPPQVPAPNYGHEHRRLR
jgi:hypothetical protein